MPGGRRQVGLGLAPELEIRMSSSITTPAGA